MRLGCGFRQPNFVPKFRASVIGIGPYALRGDEGRHAGSSCPTGGCGEPPRLPWVAAHSGASAAQTGGTGGNRGRDHPKSVQQRRTIPQSAFGRQLPLHKGALGAGGTDCHVGPAGLLAMTVLILRHSEEAQRADVGIRPFYDGRGFGPPYLGHGLRRPNFVPKFGASVRSSAPTEGLLKSQQRADVVIGPYGMKRKPAATAEAALSEAESAERAAGQIQSLPDTLRVQHGVLSSEICGKSRPCSRWHYLN